MIMNEISSVGPHVKPSQATSPKVFHKQLHWRPWHYNSRHFNLQKFILEQKETIIFKPEVILAFVLVKLASDSKIILQL